MLTVNKIYRQRKRYKELKGWDFPGSPASKTLCFHCRGKSLIPSQGTKIPHGGGVGIRRMEKQLHCNRTEKDLSRKEALCDASNAKI